jgi:hypothetical protein
MRPRNLIVSFGIGTLLVAYGLMTRGKEGMYFFFMGAVMLLSSVAIAVIRRGDPKPPPNNRQAIAGAILGAIAGGVLGNNFPPLGRLMIQAFNPGLPEQDFAAGRGDAGCDAGCDPHRFVSRPIPSVASHCGCAQRDPANIG